MTTGRLTPERLAVRGIIGTLLIALTVVAAMNINRLPLVGHHDVIEVELAEAGGLRGGDAVMISGARVGTVREVGIVGTHVAARIVLTDPDVRLGRSTEARIITVTLLGRAALALTPRGTGRLRPGDRIPVERTSSPYNLTSTLNQLTGITAAIDKPQLSAALEQAATVLDATSPDLGPALRGIVGLSRAVSSNDGELRSLVARAARVSDVLADRDQQITTLLGAGRSLLSELDARQEVVTGLLADARRLAVDLRTLLSRTDDLLGPALDQLQGVIDVLDRNRADLQRTITGLRGYATAFGEAISSGPWFDAYIQNLTAPATLAPILSGALR